MGEEEDGTFTLYKRGHVDSRDGTDWTKKFESDLVRIPSGDKAVPKKRPYWEEEGGGIHPEQKGTTR